MTPSAAAGPAASVLRPVDPPAGIKGRLAAAALDRVDLIFRILRNAWPIPRAFGWAAVTRYDDVREVYANDAAFAVPYAAKLDVIMGGEPFFLGMADTPDYTRDTSVMRVAVRRQDVPSRLAPATEARAERAVAEAGGRIEVVGQLVRDVTFDVLGDYFGTDGAGAGDLKLWATRLFEFQFADLGDDPALRAEVDVMAPALRAHVDRLIARRRDGAAPARDDVLGRCLAMQRAGLPGVDDARIRSALVGFIVGGLPQPPMVVPQALEQLLRRPAALASAQAAARAGDDAGLAGHVFEAMRFDPLAPGLTRTAVADFKIAAGTWRAATIAKGTRVFVAFRSAMRDGRRVPRPERFDPGRPPWHYLHFGHGLHACFGLHINQAILPLMLKPLLRRPGLRRAPGPEGHLSKRGPFADRLTVEYDPA